METNYNNDSINNNDVTQPSVSEKEPYFESAKSIEILVLINGETDSIPLFI